MKKTKIKGQALVETAFVVPLLTFLLVGIGYFGSLMTIQHNLTVSARYATRIVSMESTKENFDKQEGTFFAKLTEEDFKKNALKSLHGFDESRLDVKPLSILDLAKINGVDLKGKLEPIILSKGYAYIYKLEGKARANSNSMKGDPVKDLLNLDVGIGNIFFCARYTYRLKELDWMSKFLFRREGITLEAISLMPAELPLRGMGYGVMNINKGLFDIIRLDVHEKTSETDNHQYEDLVPPPSSAGN